MFIGSERAKVLNRQRVGAVVVCFAAMLALAGCKNGGSSDTGLTPGSNPNNGSASATSGTRDPGVNTKSGATATAQLPPGANEQGTYVQPGQK